MKAQPRRSPHLERAIAQGRVSLNERNKTAVIRTGLLKTYEQSNWNSFTAPLLAGLRKNLGLKAELRGLGYTVRTEHA